VLTPYMSKEYDVPGGVFCPSKEFADQPDGNLLYTYAYNYRNLGNHSSLSPTVRRATDILDQSETLTYGDNGESLDDIGRYWSLMDEFGVRFPIGSRHSDSANAVFMDVHVEIHTFDFWIATENRYLWDWSAR